MAYWKNREGGHHVAAQKEFVCDATTDLDTILTDHSNLPAGAKALVIETGGRYMLNSDGEWILQSCHSGGGSGSSGSGSGGSGSSSPFSEFTVTFDLTEVESDSGTVGPAASYMISDATIAYPDTTSEHYYFIDSITSESTQVTVLAYNGVAYFGNYMVFNRNNSQLQVDNETLSENLEYDDDIDMFILTGDATISGSIPVAQAGSSVIK